ncbi:cadmium transporter [Paenibacillus swuensis]|uniref:Cd(2+)-exporting ATPase n=1 Tax=Paenibacillus swuensis TaxID=1178515 RepID=A0A172TMM4_9BACL|nr:cation-translocating P-type ATPase [Paenibacillus swuensis]ANE48232.1 cadmium transporter [Paenibacillus swuensis]
MKEYKVKGLTCANCAQGLQEQLNRLEYGESARLSYNSGKLTVDPKVSLDAVKKVLKSDGAFIDSAQGDPHHAHHHDHNHGHAHDHSHEGNDMMKRLLFVGAILFVAVIAIESQIPDVPAVILYLLSMALSGYKTFLKGMKNLLRLKFNIDTLMTIALVGAIGIGEWKEATLVALLFGLNELLEGLGMEKARKSMEALLQVAPKEATVISGGQEQVVPISSLRAGDIVLVRSGEKIPSDGTVIEGKSSVNEAAITGESLPVEKGLQEPVYGGSINNEGVLKIRMDKAYQDSSLAKILHLVEEAQETKTPTELFINRFARYYTPAIILISLLVLFIPPVFLGGAWEHWIYQALAVLIVGCPCALILSSPIAIVSGITRNARNGILIKGGVFLEQLGRMDTLAFDKTGTLTKGEPHVEQVRAYDEHLLYKIAYAAEKSSSHPLAKAVVSFVSSKGMVPLEAEEIQTVSGQGIKARIQGQMYTVGNEHSMRHLSIPDHILQDIQALKAEGFTLVLVADEASVLGIFAISDEIREESPSVIRALHESGIKRTVMLTGDHAQTAEKVAKAVGVTEYFSNLLPEDKVAKIKDLATRGKVAMIGDGINDAPALASADLGIAMGKGTDSAIETADIVLMQDHLGKLPEAISVARRVNAIIKFNITFALGLKLIALLLTIPGWLTLWIAILSDMGATIFVTLVSLTVLLSDKKPQTQ